MTPELIAPAGDWDCAKAAVENGAAGIYFGLRSGLNARARAVNFASEELPELMTYLRRRGVNGYLTLNTLVFPEELEAAEASIRLAAAAGVDALIVQDLGLLRLARQVCPELPLHASTQMTLSSGECISQVASLGVSRVVLPRELSLKEIAQIHSQTPVELEVFVHGALCISYSGQCLASLALGGRSGNRGQCAQACRLQYEMLAKNETCEISSKKKYLFSPSDLAAFDLLPELIAAGVSALKIEGRLKEPEYVAVVTGFYRRALDEVAVGRRPRFEAAEIAELEAAFSRGFSHGWLEGPDPKALVAGDSSAKRGVLLGEVRSVCGSRVRIVLTSPVRRGMGVVFEGDRENGDEQGGRIYEIFHRDRSVEEKNALGEVELAFRHGSLDFEKIGAGQKLWITDDPKLAKKWRQLVQSEDARRRVALDLTVEATCGRPLVISGRTATGATCHVESPSPLEQAEKHPLDKETLQAQLGRLGGTVYELRELEVNIDGEPMIPFSELGKLRRSMIEQLEASLERPASRTVFNGSAVEHLKKELTRCALTPGPGLMKTVTGTASNSSLNQKRIQALAEPVTLFISPPPGPSFKGSREDKSDIEIASQLHVLCRSLEQLEVALNCGISTAIAEFREVESYGDAIRKARSADRPIWLATPRIHLPDDVQTYERLERYGADGILARNMAALAYFAAKETPVVADFSLNAVNELSILELCRRGAMRVTVAYDLRGQSLAKSMAKLLETVPPPSVEVLLHSHIPMYHTAHCLYCAELSTGRDKSDCKQPCRRQSVRIRDRLGVEHILAADADCRNTLYHAIAQSTVEFAPQLLEIGVRHFRIELLDESPAQIRQTIEKYRELI